MSRYEASLIAVLVVVALLMGVLMGQANEQTRLLPAIANCGASSALS